jgi:hypothetical protein
MLAPTLGPVRVWVTAAIGSTARKSVTPRMARTSAVAGDAKRNRPSVTSAATGPLPVPPVASASSISLRRQRYESVTAPGKERLQRWRDRSEILRCATAYAESRGVRRSRRAWGRTRSPGFRLATCKVRAVTAMGANTAAAANTAAMTVDNTCGVWTTVEYRPSAQTAMDDPGRCAHYYGSDAPGGRATDGMRRGACPVCGDSVG